MCPLLVSGRCLLGQPLIPASSRNLNPCRALVAYATTSNVPGLRARDTTIILVLCIVDGRYLHLVIIWRGNWMDSLRLCDDHNWRGDGKIPLEISLTPTIPGLLNSQVLRWEPWIPLGSLLPRSGFILYLTGRYAASQRDVQANRHPIDRTQYLQPSNT